MSQKAFKILAYTPLIYTLIAFYTPLLLMLVESVSGKRGAAVYTDVLTNINYLKVVSYSGYIALLTTFITFLIALPIAYYLAFIASERLKLNLLIAFNVPLLVNLLLRTYALLNILMMLNIAGTFQGLMIGMIYQYFPLMLLPIYSSFERINHALIEAAETLGARPKEQFLKVILPLGLPGIVSGATLVSLTAFTDFVTPAMLGGNHGYTLGYLIWDLFLKYRNWETGSALAFIITLVAVAVSTIYTKWGVKIEA